MKWLQNWLNLSGPSHMPSVWSDNPVTQRFWIYYNCPEYLDGHAFAVSKLPTKITSIRVYTVCHTISTFLDTTLEAVKKTHSNFSIRIKMVNVLLNLDMPYLCKQCRSRSVGFYRSQLIWICSVCYSVYEFISKTLIKKSDWLKIRSGHGIMIYLARQGLKYLNTLAFLSISKISFWQKHNHISKSKGKLDECLIMSHLIWIYTAWKGFLFCSVELVGLIDYFFCLFFTFVSNLIINYKRNNSAIKILTSFSIGATLKHITCILFYF